jgi:drug/metabolite transporter (DMT)-like permease
VTLAVTRTREAQLRWGDALILVAVVALGGLLGPVLQLYGLDRTAGSTASLLLNLEVVFTMLVAVALFRDHIGRREAAAAVLVVGGAAWLSWVTAGGGASRTSTIGAAAIAGSCLAWAVDNNLTQKLSARDPRAITAVKGLGAGACAALLAWLTKEAPPAPKLVGIGLALGAISYGSSLVLYVRALRGLGAARTGALFATAPFVGAIVSFALLGEHPRLIHLGAGGLMAAGVMLLTIAGAAHAHEHQHEALEHEHLHTHDDHHQHDHTGSEGPEPHSHPHRHAPIRHAHPHAPDLHHRHRH